MRQGLSSACQALRVTIQRNMKSGEIKGFFLYAAVSWRKKTGHLGPVKFKPNAQWVADLSLTSVGAFIRTADSLWAAVVLSFHVL